MAEIRLQEDELRQLIDSVHKPIVQAQKVDCPYTTVVGRAQMLDLSQDLGVRFGIDRFQTQEIVALPSESGPNGEPVYKPVNDWQNAVRFVGPWISENTAYGQRITCSPDTDPNYFIEFSFYGTGLNLLTLPTSNTLVYDVDVDGVAGSSVSVGGVSTILQSRNYSPNCIYNIISGLSFGFHTVKIKGKSGNTASKLSSFGHEVINEDSDLLVTKGSSFRMGKKATLVSDLSLSYDDTDAFDAGSDTYDSSVGGRVKVYQNGDGTIGKRLRSVDAAPAYLSSVDHSNEEVIRTYNWREFGVARTDDFSTLVASASDRAFTLDDGTTTLVCDDCQNADLSEGVASTSANDFVTLTFVGTGIDVDNVKSGSIAGSTVNIYIDGVDINSGPVTSTDLWEDGSVGAIGRIASGLPYGTHTLKIQLAGGVSVQNRTFYVYGPKEPEMPEDAVALGEYYLMADFVPITTAGVDSIATGVLRQDASREAVYSGTYTIQAPSPIYVGGSNVGSNTSGGYAEYTFWGVGINLRHYAHTNNSANTSITVNGVALTSANFSTAVVGVVGAGIEYDGQTGNNITSFSTNTYDAKPSSVQQGVGFFVKGLPLAMYTIRFTSNDTDARGFDSFDIITPVHCPKNNGPYVVQNTLPIGNCAVGDLRNFSENEVKHSNFYCFDKAVATLSAIGTTFSPIDVFAPIYLEEESMVEIEAYIRTEHTDKHVYMDIYVDGKNMDTATLTTSMFNHFITGGTLNFPIQAVHRMRLSKGYHFVNVFQKTNSGAILYSSDQRFITIRKID